MLNAAGFEAYLEQRWASFVHGEGNVRCGDCRGCCRADYTIGLSPAEAEKLPHTVIDGHAVILPLANGYCPFLIDEACSVYADRPASCRQFDCRDMTMAAVRITDQPGGVREINASADRFLAENGGLTPSSMADLARRVLADLPDTPVVVAAQNALVLNIIRFFPKDKSDQMVAALLSPAEGARAAAMKAADKERAHGKPS